jgi:spore germination protein KC
MNKKHIAFFLILIILSTILTGSGGARGVETLAYVVAIGIDKGDTNVIKLTFQFASPTGGEKSGSSSSSSQSDSSSITTIECSSIDSGISLMNSYLTKKVDLSHCKAIVISEELALLRDFRVY